jgi:hypothetical protein
MVAEMRAAGSFDYNSAAAFAEKHGLNIRSVIAKVRALELPYKAKDAKAPSNKPKARLKADVVASIEARLGVTLKSLEKMTLADLETLETVV